MLTFVLHQKSLAELRSTFTSESIRDAKVLMALVLMRLRRSLKDKGVRKLRCHRLKCQCKCQFEGQSFDESNYIIQTHWLHVFMLLWKAGLGIRARNVHSKPRDPSPPCEQTRLFLANLFNDLGHKFEWHNPR